MHLFSFAFISALLACSLTCSLASATNEPEAPYDVFDRGLVYENQMAQFKLNTRFRMQNRITFEDYDEDDTLNNDTLDFAVRRLRLRFDGHVADPRLLFRFQLAFTRADMDFDTNNYPNILRDAVVGWKITPSSTVWFGQGKLPGNRQRVTSSSAQEFVDRSLLNATFNIDRDLGVQFWQKLGEERPLWIKVAVTNGEGRANPNKSLSVAYTGRVEWLPLGNFKDDGDYFEGDLSFEESPKFSIGAVHSFNKNTNRVGGQIGKTLVNNESRDLRTSFVDVLMKYRGWAFSSEFAYRSADNPVITNAQSVYAGKGVNAQLSYNFPSHYAPAIRYTRLWANQEILSVENDRTQYTLGLTKYIRKHKIKLQSDFTYELVSNPSTVTQYDNFIIRLQLELGI